MFQHRLRAPNLRKRGYNRAIWAALCSWASAKRSARPPSRPSNDTRQIRLCVPFPPFSARLVLGFHWAVSVAQVFGAPLGRDLPIQTKRFAYALAFGLRGLSTSPAHTVASLLEIPSGS